MTLLSRPLAGLAWARAAVGALGTIVALSLASTNAGGQMVSRMLVKAGERTIALDAVGYQRGNPSADVWVVEFADFGCGYCEKFFRETLPVFDSLYINKGRIYWKFVPFTLGTFPNSGHAAEASICAAEQGRFFPMHDVLYDKRKEWMKASDARGQMTTYAQRARLDLTKFAACMKGKGAGEQLARNNVLARTLMVRGTPTFFINGEVIPGALPTDVFVKGMDAVIKSYGGRGGR
ncbi:MAG: thioredoxin domain-containing protein [Gemmatimonadaceae bacterium]|nr:thioredoxin domain-containing protein [Gemmatimonadaceae bacterium]